MFCGSLSQSASKGRAVSRARLSFRSVSSGNSGHPGRPRRHRAQLRAGFKGDAQTQPPGRLAHDDAVRLGRRVLQQLRDTMPISPASEVESRREITSRCPP